MGNGKSKNKCIDIKILVMDLEKRIDLISQPPTEEVVTRNDLRKLLQTKSKPIAYDGFEPSGKIHLGTGVLRAIKLQDMIDAKCKFKLYIADWFALINNKMGGDMNLIKDAGKYFIEGWKACGVDVHKIEIVWCSDLIKDPSYWDLFIKLGKKTTLKRAIRCLTIMGREESELSEVAQLFYPIMQCTDIFKLGADITQLGMDQRKVNILAREIGPKLGFWKPVIVSHHLLMGLQGPGKMGGFEESKELNEQISFKMSKSKPYTAIFIHDSEKQIKDKIKQAYCKPKQTENNPVLEICKYIIFRKQKSFEIKRKSKFGGDISFSNYDDLEKQFRNGQLHPLDLKNSVSDSLIKILKPVRKHFEKGQAKKLYERVKKAKVGR